MTKVKRGMQALLSEENKRKKVTEIVDYFAVERNETIGIIAAEEILDFMIESFGSDIYNKGVDDAFQFMKERLSAAELDMNAMVKK